MTSEIELPFPGNRTLAGWWRQFASLRPKALWVGHFPLQTLELLVEASHPTSLDRSTRLLLEAIQTLSGSRTQWASRLGLSLSFLEPLLEKLYRSRLILNSGDTVRLGSAGEEAIREGRYSEVQRRRQSFALLALPASNRVQYVPFTASLRLPPWAGRPDGFPVLKADSLQPFLEASLARKEELGFPLDVETVVASTGLEAIPLQKVERLTSMLIAVPQGSGEIRLQLYPVRPETWSIPGGEPLIAVYPDDLVSSSLEAWQTAWWDWCRSRNVLVPEVESATVELEESQVVVRLHQPLPEGISKQFEDWLKSELWLLAGSETLKEARPLQIVRTLG